MGYMPKVHGERGDLNLRVGNPHQYFTQTGSSESLGPCKHIRYCHRHFVTCNFMKEESHYGGAMIACPDIVISSALSIIDHRQVLCYHNIYIFKIHKGTETIGDYIQGYI